MRRSTAAWRSRYILHAALPPGGERLGPVATARQVAADAAALFSYVQSIACRLRQLRLPSTHQAGVGEPMVFSSSVFLFYFLPLFLICYFALPFKNLVLLVFSLFFYAWGEGLYVVLMLASGIGNWAAARWIAANSGVRARASLALGVALNLAGLFVFKYLGFF